MIDTSDLRAGGYASTAIPRVPQKIREMIRLYEYRGESIEEKCRNFYRQGKFMEDYADDAPWTGEYRRYFTTYHDLHLPQLRGYFTWRTALRRGEFRPIAASLAYMYVYELLCGIGASSPEDSLHKMQEFEKGFLDSGIGDSFMRRNLHQPDDVADLFCYIGAGEVFQFTVDVCLQASETEDFRFATVEEIKALADQGMFLHYDSIRQIFE